MSCITDASLTVEKKSKYPLCRQKCISFIPNCLRFYNFVSFNTYLYLLLFFMIKLFIFLNKLLSDTCLTETHSNLLLHCAATVLSG